MQVWVKTAIGCYDLTGKFPYTLVDRLEKELKIEKTELTIGSFKQGYKVIHAFSIEVGGVFLNFNDTFLITGD